MTDNRIYSQILSLDEESLKISRISGKIHINNNWSDAKDAGICTGEGTYSDPYIIEDFVIDGRGLGRCLWVENSSVFFKIKNCTIYNSGQYDGDAGIRLSSVSNGNITNCNCYNNRAGIYLDHSSNITIFETISSNNNLWGIKVDFSNNNTFLYTIANNNGGMGFFLKFSSHNIIVQNEALNNGWDGFLIRDCSSIILSDNVASNHLSYGINLEESNNCRIRNNTLHFNGNALRLSHSYYNTIEKNSLVYSSNRGIWFWMSGNNVILLNSISNNDYGVFIHGSKSKYNQFYLNEFIDNDLNAWDENGNNHWDNGEIGNYWDDYIGVDLDDDGIGDSPYDIPGSAGAQDRFPLMVSPFIDLEEIKIKGYSIFYYVILFFTMGISSIIILIISKKKKNK